MTRYELLQDWKSPAGHYNKGEISTRDGWHDKHIFDNEINNPDWFRAVPEWKKGDVVIVGDATNVIEKACGDGCDLVNQHNGRYHVATSLISPAPPMPAEPVMYQGKPHRVLRKNGVPVRRRPEFGEIYYDNDIAVKNYGDFSEKFIRYILTPCEWEPKAGERYDFVTTKGLVVSAIYGQTATHQRRRDIGNCFEHDTLDPAKVREIMIEAYKRVKKEARK